MNAKLSELLAAWPEALGEAAGMPRDQLIGILADISKRPVPTGSVHRLWSVSDLSAQVALAYFAWWARQWFDSAEAGQRRLMDTNLAVALKIFHRLGYLRGMLAKLGQAAGSLPHLLPDDVIATLDRLHFDAPPMHYSLIRELLRDELGAEPEEVFASFEQHAFAAASLGQVHRARLKSGEAVAVKLTEEYVNWVSEPLQHNSPFDFGDQSHLERGVEWLARIAGERRSPIHPMYFYWNRSVFGLTALLYRLHARVDVCELMKQESRILNQCR